VLQYGCASIGGRDKLRLKSDFDRVRASGIKEVGRFVVLVWAKASDDKLRCGVVCGRRFSKKAVDRNRAKRLLWESFRLLKACIRTSHVLLIPRSHIASRHVQDVQRDLIRILKLAGLWITEKETRG